MELARALDLCTHTTKEVAGSYEQNDPEGDALDEAAETLRRWKPFIEASLEWGANSLKWDKHDGPDSVRALRNEAHEICVRMDQAYRAAMEAEECPDCGQTHGSHANHCPEVKP